MSFIQPKQHYRKLAVVALTAIAFSGANAMAAETKPAAETNPATETVQVLDETAFNQMVVEKTALDILNDCQRMFTSCEKTTKEAKGILVFPKVVKADLIIGGAGGKGALMEDGRVTGYYSLGAASASLQAGVEDASQVYVFRTPEALAKLKTGSDWKVGAETVLVKKGADVSVAAGKIPVYVFDIKGLRADISLDVFDIWKTGSQRPGKV